MSAHSIVALWVSTVVFAHVFALYWLIRTALIGRTSIFAKRRRTKRFQEATQCHGGAASAHGRVVDALADVGAGGRDQQKALASLEDGTPFVHALKTLRPVQSSESLTAEEDEVPDMSPVACATLKQHMSVAPETFDMEWQEMGCSYNIQGTAKVVLQDIWGRAYPGEMQALMGPSGAGKSTFMDILAMRKSVGHISGRLLLSGKPATPSFIRQTAYVPQEDNFVPTMTANETLSFYASVILPSSWSSSSKCERVLEVMDAVGLGHCQRTLVGGTLPGGLMMRGLSGGERKRLSIAAGILAAPAVLFLDEPTSGLDSFAALSVMGHLQRMARVSEHIIIATIHQPRSAIWQMFDKVTLLANGRLMYHGPRDSMTDWFSNLGYVHDPSDHGVASDWALDLVAVGFAKPPQYFGHTMRTKDDLAAASEAFLDHYTRAAVVTQYRTDSEDSLDIASRRKHGHSRNNSSSLVGKVRSVMTGGTPIAEVLPERKYPTGPFRQFLSLLHREFVLVTRNPFDVAARCLTFTWVGILIGMLYYGLPDDGTSLRSRLNLTFLALNFVVLMPYISMGLYTSDKKFYLADASAKLYRPLCYYVAKVLVTTPFQIVCALCFSFTLYGMAGLREGGLHIIQFGCIITLVYLISVQVLHAAAMVAPNQDTAFMLSIIWTTIQILASSFFVSFNEVITNFWLTQLRYISALYFGLEALVLNEFYGLTYDCSAGIGNSGYMNFIMTAFPKLTNAQKSILQSLERPQPGCVLDTAAVINYFDFARPFGVSVGILLGYLGVVHCLTFAFMMLSARKEAR